MLSFRPHQLAFFLLFHCLLLAIVPAYAVPVAVKRQDDSAATTVMTQTTTTTLAGDMTQTCVITLTPITDDNGNPAVRQVKTCTVTMGGVNNGADTGGTNAGGGTNTGGGTDNGGNNSGSTTSSDSSGSPTSTAADNGSTSSSAGGGGGGGPSANGVSNVPRPSATSTDSTGSSTTNSAGSSATNSAGSGAGSTNSASTSSSATGSTQSGAGSGGGGAVSENGVSTVAAPSSTNPPGSAAEQQAAPSESTAFTVPGQKLQVLPIGLGVFAGISVIALIVVGLVTYERTKYRKAFRARKLAESGAGIGYGGMAQRS
ncbi:hypothetical protein C8J57DRAFT_585615 [Mycena rebaudengoi]|nr:hypothetical protein C8J57DRAFT_585615 [Mycena rebaudengoi]